MEKEAGCAFVHRWEREPPLRVSVFAFFSSERIFISNMFDRPGERLACDAFVLCYACFIPSRLGG